MQADDSMSKVPAVTLAFWVIKVVAATLGEAAAVAVSMTVNWGYALSSVLFIAVFVVAVAAQIAARRFHPFLYWGLSSRPQRLAPPWRISQPVRWVSGISAGR